MPKRNFEISPRVLYHLGEDLIKNEEIALFELVKNSYDACASKCKIFFRYENKTLKEIVIEDDGIGMDKSIIENIWLVIGTDYKSDIKEIKCKRNGKEFTRVPLGEKGIGRLSIHKLGNEITLYSKMNNKMEVKVHIDWDEINKVNTFKEFYIDVEDKNNINHIEGNGTKIVVNKIKGEWSKRKLRKLYRSLLSLNSPFEDTVDNFKVIVDSSDNKLFEGLPSLDEIKRSALYYGRCKIEDDRIVDFYYEFKPWDILKKVHSRKKTIDDLKETECILKKVVRNKPVDLNLNKYKIGSIELEILIYDFDPSFMNLNFSNAVIEKSSLREYLNENGGVRVYRDGIRVYDYGIEHDWLGIDLKRVGRVGGKISNNIVIGAVKLNRKLSTDLKEKTNREGFVENEAYFALVDAVNFALDKIVLERNIDKNRLKELYKQHKVSEPVLSDLEEVKELVEKKLKDDKETRDEIVQYLERINKQYKEVKEVLIRSANAGLNLSVVIHEIEKLIFGLSGAIRNNDIEKIKTVAGQLEKIVQSFNVMIKSSKVKEDFLSSIVQAALDTFHFRFKDHNIKLFTNYDEKQYKAYFAKSEAVSVLANLLDNSIFWLSYSKETDRKLSIFLTNQIEGYYSIIVSDNGPGFSISPQDAVKPFITAKPHSIGSGLGLHIADEMMKAMKGKLLFLTNYDIELPKNTVKEGVTQAIVALCFPKKKVGE